MNMLFNNYLLCFSKYTLLPHRICVCVATRGLQQPADQICLPKHLRCWAAETEASSRAGEWCTSSAPLFFLPISALGDVFPYPKVTFLVPGLHSMGDNKSCRKSALGLFILFSPHSLAEVLQLSYLPSTGLQTINQPQPPTRGEKHKETDVRSLRLLLL